MNVRLNHVVSRPVLWQRNADWSRYGAASAHLDRAGGASPIRGVRWLRWRLGVRPLHAPLRRRERALYGGMDAAGGPGRGGLPNPPRWPASRVSHTSPVLSPGHGDQGG